MFSQYKANFKAARARKLMGLIQVSHEDMVRSAWTGIRKKNVVKCIEHVERLLR